MDKKTLSAIAVSTALILVAVAAIVVSVNRSDAAKAEAEREAAAADRAQAEARKVSKEAEIEASKRRTAEASEKAAADEKAAKELAAENLKTEEKIAADKKAAAEATAQAERAKADTARAVKDEARAKADQAKAEEGKAKEIAAAAQAKADEAALQLSKEKLKADKIIAEAKALELRKIDYETLERDLLEWKLDLEERERALKPEKTIADLNWAGGMEDTIIDAEGNVKKQVKKQYDPEKDTSLPEASRKLEKTQRIVREKQNAQAAETRDAILASMEKLYVTALKDGRVIDADFYRKSILTMYPDWKFGGEKLKDKGEGEVGEKK